MRINVTQQHIMKGLRKSPVYCPISRSINKATGLIVTTQNMRNSPNVILRDGHGYWRDLALTRNERKFINNFDRGNPVSPFSFELPIDKDTWHGKEESSNG